MHHSMMAVLARDSVCFLRKMHCEITAGHGKIFVLQREGNMHTKVYWDKVCGLSIIIITGGQSNLTTNHIAAAHGQFNGVRQVVPMCTLHASFGPPESKSQTASLQDGTLIGGHTCPKGTLSIILSNRWMSFEPQENIPRFLLRKIAACTCMKFRIIVVEYYLRAVNIYHRIR